MPRHKAMNPCDEPHMRLIMAVTDTWCDDMIGGVTGDRMKAGGQASTTQHSPGTDSSETDRAPGAAITLPAKRRRPRVAKDSLCFDENAWRKRADLLL